MNEKLLHDAPCSGPPVCCAAGLTHNDIVEKEGPVERAAFQGNRPRDGLQTLMSRPSVGEIHGSGMTAGAELSKDNGTGKSALGLRTRVAPGWRQVWPDHAPQRRGDWRRPAATGSAWHHG